MLSSRVAVALTHVAFELCTTRTFAMMHPIVARRPNPSFVGRTMVHDGVRHDHRSPARFILTQLRQACFSRAQTHTEEIRTEQPPKMVTCLTFLSWGRQATTGRCTTKPAVRWCLVALMHHFDDQSPVSSYHGDPFESERAIQPTPVVSRHLRTPASNGCLTDIQRFWRTRASATGSGFRVLATPVR